MLIKSINVRIILELTLRLLLFIFLSYIIWTIEGEIMKINLKKNKILISFASVFILFIVIYILICILAGGKTFIANTTINGIDVGQLSESEAITQIQQQYQKDQEHLLLSLNVDDQTYQVNVSDCVKMDIEQEVNQIAKKNNHFFKKAYYYLFDHDETTAIKISDKKQFETNINNSKILDYSTLIPTTYEIKEDQIIFTKGTSGKTVDKDDVYQQIETALKNYTFKDPIDIPTIDSKETEEVMTEIYKAIPQKAVNATLDKNNNYAIVDSQIGVVYDEKEALKKFNDTKEGKQFSLKATITQPTITKEMLEQNLFKDVLGEYSTYVSGTSVRKNNVKLSGEKCNNVILLPGEEFSYNTTVGKRTKEAGFGEAAAYLNGETVQEVGGGICQTSSTLYNAVVFANLEVTERYNHTYISSYVPIGRDATVSWNGPDLKFKNNKNYPIKIVVTYANNRINTKIYGTDEDGYTVEFTSSQTATIPFNTKYENDATLPEGTEQIKQAGSNGAKAVSYRKIYDRNGKLISSKKESSSVYKSHDAIILKGTMKVETPTVPNPTQPGETTPPVTQPGNENVPAQ